jgi:flavodoxin
LKAAIIYDSVYGNTEKIGQAIAGALGLPDEVGLYRASGLDPEKIRGADLVFIGAPTQGFRPTEPVRKFLEHLPGDGLKGSGVAAFDTRIGGKEAGGALRLMMKMGGYAAPRIAGAIRKKGGELLVPAEGFLVKGKEGPLVEGETERAASWAKTVLEAHKAHLR